MKILKRLAHRARDFLIRPLLQNKPQVAYADAASQLQLKLTYQMLAESSRALPGLAEVGFKLFSQTDEDGILLYIFSLIGTTNKTSVEICAGNGIECNTANLILNHGWRGLLVDGDAARVKLGVEFYRRHPNSYVYPPTFVNAWVTRDNVNDLITRHGFAGECDLLSIDMDGVDYWIWDAITALAPRVVVVEYQDILGPDRSLTVPYEESFDAHKYPMTQSMPNFSGASLLAFTKLANRRGYRLVGCNRYGFNAFFIKNPLGEATIPEVQVNDCFQHAKVQWGMKERYPTVKDLPWVEV